MISTDPAVAEWLIDRGYQLPSDARVMGIAYEGDIVGALIYSRWRWSEGRLIDLELSIECERPESFTRTVQRAMLDYPFRQLGAERVTVLVTAGTTAERMARFHGFVHEGVMRRRSGPDQQVYGRLNDGG